MKRILERLALAGLVIAGASACSAHNSHSVVVDPVETLPVLVKEALLQLQENLGEPLPADSMAIGIEVDHVDVRWVAPADSPRAGIAAPAELEPLLFDAVRERIAEVDPELAKFLVELELELDLNDPDELALRVTCDLREAEGRKRLASGCSGYVLADRLYCHGCRDSFGSVGSHIDRGGASGSGDYGAGFFYYPVCPSSSSGYVKH